MSESRVREYDVVALRVPVAYNSFGDHDRHGALYVLAENAPALREVAQTWPDPFPSFLTDPDLVPKPHPLAVPLVLRARRGERVRVRLTNELPRPVGITAQGVRYDARRHDGLEAGANPDTSVQPGDSRVYEWLCEHEGVFHFGDMADVRGEGTQSHGLNGALVVEPRDATWTDPRTGGPLASGISADVHTPGRSFREHVIVMMEYPSNDNPVTPPVAHDHGGHGAPMLSGQAPFALPSDERPDDIGDLEPVSNAMLPVNLRIEPLGWRQYVYNQLLEQHRLDPLRDAQTGEELHHSSWVYGDPATPVFFGYRGDNVVLRLLHGGMRDTHVFHTHLHQWRVDPDDDRSPLVDSVSFGPQQGLTLDLVGGAGSVQHAVGDAVWHCHLYPHFHMGMWGLLRAFDTRQDGSGRYPDGTVIEALVPLPGNDPPAPTTERPGWPAFMREAATFPQKSPRPPRTPGMPAGMGREPTSLEAAAFVPDAQPGEAFTKVGPADAPVRRYHLVVTSATIVHTGDPHDHHRPLWHDHNGHFFALHSDVDAAGGIEEFRRQVNAGERTVEPLVIRARKGEVLEMTLTNGLPTGAREGSAFDPPLPFQPECGLHSHLVKYDPLVSDGACIGWNYLSATTTADLHDPGADGYRSWVFRWYVDEDFGTVLFHDHLLPNYRQRHGLYGVLVAEPEGARWVDPADHSRELPSGSQAVVLLADGSAVREQVLAVADFVPAFEHTAHGHGGAINPPPSPGSMDEQGVMAVNYRAEPLDLRGGDPADWFATEVHGDPTTPLLRAYPGERIRIRLVDGSFDKQHSFTTHGLRWREWPDRADTPWRSQQTLGVSNAADLHLEPTAGPGDHLWSFAAADDLWLGCWGLIRVHDGPRDDLPALPGVRSAALPARSQVRRYTVRARARTLEYSGERYDPYGLVYEVDGVPFTGPLVLRARAGEWVAVTLINELDGPPPASEFDPVLLTRDIPGRRTVSGRVSLHPVGLRYDTALHDGTRVGTNPDSTVKPGGTHTYWWHTDEPGVVLLRDHADPITHLRRGLIGALVVEPADSTPESWTGTQTRLRRPGKPATVEQVLITQDALRLYHDGDLTQPVRDLVSEAKDDLGQKAYNYRSAHLHPVSPSLADHTPPTPLVRAKVGQEVVLHLAVAGSRIRNQGFTIHGQTWPLTDHGPHVSTLGALASGATRTIRFTPHHPGDYVYRTPNLHWGVSEGWWGLIRVT
ncbi:multicopper oxidase domain-containing protein [Actinokineospora diospyrosa]|uniref:Multicopper oxidase with three cupredoxin domains (Includes cell division protein FtsP and spore coat protein CotA) n=1 Tax=Actinokineospora diospyrosa TaxID=103728 RepID=A0ABT1I5E3_9PSEU|nr:multicopper oxidase domain-containing protein [Actinokineospora diospyrosa]MCP2267843.1 Multicopper oxidase with three cupredoxin domains (includes cell division protein FtsP and spore coat protein CotA) [Actinokineospora diospyrosa]